MIPPEIAKLIDQSFAADREREKQRRTETGELDIELEGAPTDPPVNDAAFQAEVYSFGAALRQAGISHSQRFSTFDSAGAQGHAVAEFVIQLLSSPVVGVVGTAIGVWLKGRYGRKVRLKFGDVDVEARTPEEVDQLLKSAVKFRAKMENKGEP